MNRIAIRQVFAATVCVATLLFGALWWWSTLWLQSSVVAMADQLEKDGVVDAQKAAAIRGDYQSTGSFLMQGWNTRALLWGKVLWIAGVAGSGLGVVVAWRRPARVDKERRTK